VTNFFIFVLKLRMMAEKALSDLSVGWTIFCYTISMRNYRINGTNEWSMNYAIREIMRSHC